MFRSGFHLCAKEVLHYLANKESSADLTPSHVIGHIQKVAAEVLQCDARPDESAVQASEKVNKPVGQAAIPSDIPAKNCVPVIQRTYHHGTGEHSGSDTDTDSGYGGEHDKPKSQWTESHRKEGELKSHASEQTAGSIKQEGDEPRAKRSRSDSSEDEIVPVHAAAAAPGSYMGFSPNQPPFCLPFYLLPPTAAAAAAYLPMLEKCWYSGSVPVMYPGMSARRSAGLPPETLSSSVVMSPRAGSPGDSAALHKALKQVPPLNLETKD